MVKQSNKTTQRQPLTWSMVFASMLATIGLIAFTAFTLTHWVEKQILTTDTWVQTVSELPKNEEVATSLSTYTMDQLFTATDLQNKIEQALPERAGFLAAPLTDNLQSFLTKQTKRVIQSDQFQSVWISANRAAIDRLVTGARTPVEEDTSQPAQLSVPLTILKDSITTVLTNRGLIGDSSTSLKQSPLVVNLKTSVETVQQQIRLIDFLNATLWVFALVCLFGALVLSRNRRRLLLIVAISVIVISLLQLIGIRALRPTVLNFFADANSAAAGVVYDTLLTSFKQSTTWVLIGGVVASIIIFFLSPKILRKSKTMSKWLDAFKVSGVWSFWNSLRSWTAKYRWYIVGLAILIGLTLAAFYIPVSWQNVTLTLLFIILIAEVTSLMAAGRPRSEPM